MRFAGYEQEGRLADHGYCRGVLRTSRGVGWHCEHEHESRAGAVTCAYQAEGQAVAAGLLPEPEQVRWLEPSTWPPELAHVVALARPAVRV